MTTLHLNLKKKWFDMILSGEKKEEYRDIKPYWIRRVLPSAYLKFSDVSKITKEYLLQSYGDGNAFDALVENFDTITFKNGYASNAPEMVIECRHITIDEGHVDWGAEPGTKYFVISLGEILSTKNIKQ